MVQAGKWYRVQSQKEVTEKWVSRECYGEGSKESDNLFIPVVEYMGSVYCGEV